MKSEQSQSFPEPPVSTRDHYEIMKFAEQKVKEELSGIEHDWLLVGLRVGYYELPPEDSGDLGKEYKLECGYLEALDCAEEIEVKTKEEWQRIVEEGRYENPLPIEFVDELYEKVKVKLEESARGQELLVGVFGVLIGSASRCWGTGCYCPNRTKRYSYYDPNKGRCVCYCTASPC